MIPSLMFAQENQTIIDINNKTETKRKNFIGGLSAFMYDANTDNQQQHRDLSLGYIILDNIYIGGSIGSEGLSVVNRIYLGYKTEIYLTSKYKGNLKNGRTSKYGIGYELFLNKFFSINSEILYYNYKREEVKTTTSVNLNEWIDDWGSGVTTSQEYINENNSGGIILIGLQIHF